MSVISGPENLRAPALDALRAWTWKPYMKDGQPVAVDTTVTVDFNAQPRPPVQMTEMAGGSVSQPGDAPKPMGPMRISGGVMAGLILTKVQPMYPLEARVKGITGMVAMRAIISKEGNIANLNVISGPQELRGAATDAVSNWTYKPYLLNGQPVEVDTTINVNFTINATPAATPPSL